LERRSSRRIFWSFCDWRSPGAWSARAPAAAGAALRIACTAKSSLRRNGSRSTPSTSRRNAARLVFQALYVASDDRATSMSFGASRGCAVSSRDAAAFGSRAVAPNDRASPAWPARDHGGTASAFGQIELSATIDRPVAREREARGSFSFSLRDVRIAALCPRGIRRW